MGVQDPFKESIESFKSSVYGNLNYAKNWAYESLESVENSISSSLKSSINYTYRIYLDEKEDARKLLRTLRPQWFDYFGVARDKRIELLRATGLANRVTAYVLANALIFGFSRGIRGKFRNTLLFSTLGGALIVPEVVNPFNKV